MGTDNDHYCFNKLKFISRADASSDLVALFPGRMASRVDWFLFAIPSDDCMQLVKVYVMVANLTCLSVSVKEIWFVGYSVKEKC